MNTIEIDRCFESSHLSVEKSTVGDWKAHRGVWPRGRTPLMWQRKPHRRTEIPRRASASTTKSAFHCRRPSYLINGFLMTGAIRGPLFATPALAGPKSDAGTIAGLTPWKSEDISRSWATLALSIKALFNDWRVFVFSDAGEDLSTLVRRRVSIVLRLCDAFVVWSVDALSRCVPPFWGCCWWLGSLEKRGWFDGSFGIVRWLVNLVPDDEIRC